MLTMFKDKKLSLIYKFRDYFKKIQNSFLDVFLSVGTACMASVIYFLYYSGLQSFNITKDLNRQLIVQP